MRTSFSVNDMTIHRIVEQESGFTPMLDFLTETGQAYFQEVARLCGASTVFPGLDALDPRDVSEAVLWLASPAARYVTGIALPVDGGFTCK